MENKRKKKKKKKKKERLAPASIRNRFPHVKQHSVSRDTTWVSKKKKIKKTYKKKKKLQSVASCFFQQRQIAVLHFFGWVTTKTTTTKRNDFFLNTIVCYEDAVVPAFRIKLLHTLPACLGILSDIFFSPFIDVAQKCYCLSNYTRYLL